METKLDRLGHRQPVAEPEASELPQPRESGAPFVVSERAKALVETGHISRRQIDHRARRNLPLGPWQYKTATEIAAAAKKEQLELGDRAVADWQRKVAQLNAHAEISGSVGGVGVGDIVDRLHQGLDTANTLIRSFDLEDEGLARAMFGPAPSPISQERAVSVADVELSRLFDLGEAQVAKDLRKAPHHPLVKDRALFALGRAAAISDDGGEAWLALKFLPAPGEKPQEIVVHARLAGDDFRKKKEAIETLGINLLHGAYFRREELASALLDELPKDVISIDFIKSDELRLGEPPPPQEWKQTEPPHPELGSDRRPLHKAQQLDEHGNCAGVVAEIGASQLVAELFQRTRGSSRTLLERKSNYGMEMSALAYGKVERAVSRERVASMLDHEFAQFSARAKEVVPERKLFAFANTIATKSGGGGSGWLGIDFQAEPGGKTNRIVLHVRMKSDRVPDQELALKTLGINLINATQLHLEQGSAAVLRALTDGLPPDSISIDHFEHGGPALSSWHDKSIELGLLKSGLTDALLFTQSGEMKPAFDHFFKREYVVRRDRDPAGPADANLVQLDLLSFTKNGTLDEPRLLQRVQALNSEGREVIITRRPEVRDLIAVMHASGNTHQTIVVTAAEMRRLLDPKIWIKVEGGMERLLGELDGEKLQLQVAGGGTIEPKSASGRRMMESLRERGVLI